MQEVIFGYQLRVMPKRWDLGFDASVVAPSIKRVLLFMLDNGTSKLCAVVKQTFGSAFFLLGQLSSS